MINVVVASGLIWVTRVLFLIIVSTGAFRAGQQSTVIAKLPSPCYVNIGDISAFAGGKRLVKATAVIEADNKKNQETITAAIPVAKNVIIRSFAEIAERRIETAEARREMKILIQSNLDRLFGARSVRDVLFTNLLMSIS